MKAYIGVHPGVSDVFPNPHKLKSLRDYGSVYLEALHELRGSFDIPIYQIDPKRVILAGDNNSGFVDLSVKLVKPMLPEVGGNSYKYDGSTPSGATLDDICRHPQTTLVIAADTEVAATVKEKLLRLNYEVHLEN